MHRDALLTRRLTDPPRAVPLAITTELLLGGIVGLLGWFFFGFGMIFCWIFALNCDPLAGWSFRGPLETARGRVLSVEKTHFSEGGSEHTKGTPIFAYRYEFPSGDQLVRGTSYRLGARAQAEDPVTIEYPAGNPSRSRIVGYRTAPFSALVLFVTLFPLIGLTMVATRLWTGWKRRHLLKHGELAEGKLTEKQRTNARINNQPVYKLTFEFTTSPGQTAEAIVKTHNVAPLEDDELETLLYDPTKPSRAITLDHLPGRPQINEDGTISARHSRLVYLFLIVPLVSVIGHGAYAWLRYGP